MNESINQKQILLGTMNRTIGSAINSDTDCVIRAVQPQKNVIYNFEF